jgi:hypothetical protein
MLYFGEGLDGSWIDPGSLKTKKWIVNFVEMESVIYPHFTIVILALIGILCIRQPNFSKTAVYFARDVLLIKI